MLLFIIFCFAICEGGKIPINLMMTNPIQSKQLTYDVLHSTQLHSRYFVYNILQVDQNRPTQLIHFPYGKPGTSYVSSSFSYYGAPLYDYQIYYSPFFPTDDSPTIPSYVPQQQPMTPSQPVTTTTQRPLDSNDEGAIEKLDEKMDPNMELNSSMEENMNDEDDTVVVEAID